MAVSAATPPHPLDPLSIDESNIIRKAVLDAQNFNAVIKFRTIALEEPPKDELIRFLDLEHSNLLTSSSPRPARIAKVQFDVIRSSSDYDYVESWIDIAKGAEVKHRLVDKLHQAGIIVHEFKDFSAAIYDAPLFKKAIAEFDIPEGFVVTLDPWPYGGPDADEKAPRYVQGLCFARDGRNNNLDSNHYAYPIPIIPVMDIYSKEVVRIDRLATGGKQDGLKTGTHKKAIIAHCTPAEYVPELLGKPLRTDVKPLNVVQPEGPSFQVDGNLIRWQKWRFRLGFNPREGATLHDIRYDGRSVLYRCSLSEMCVPYGDPRPPFQRKQAFDFGDAGAGRAANNLALGCDCLGAIKYFDAVALDADGTATTCKNVVCLHEQDNGIGWKHTNYRTERAVVTRLRELVVQFIITLANYEYIFAYKFDQAGGFTIETRATGIVSVVNIDEGKTSLYGNVVSGGALAQNHQHLFCVRIDPAIDGHSNTIVREESLPMDMCKDTNPYGTGYEVRQTTVSQSQYFDASPFTNLTVKITNPAKINPISKKPVAYKFVPSPTQLLLAHPDSIMSKRAEFAKHHVWVTKYKDGEYYAGGEFTNQSQKEVDGVADAVARKDSVDNEDVVVWHTFGLTHNPRVEDWPVMPVEIHQIHLRPSDFFTGNPAIDVPGAKNNTSVLVDRTQAANGITATNCINRNGQSCSQNGAQSAAESHLQGSGPDYDPNARA